MVAWKIQKKNKNIVMATWDSQVTRKTKKNWKKSLITKKKERGDVETMRSYCN